MLKINTDDVINAAISPDGKYFAYTKNDPDGVVWLVDATSGALLGTFLHQFSVTLLRFDQSSTRLISVDSIADSIISEVQIHEPGNPPHHIATIQLRGFSTVLTTPDGRYLTTRDVPGPLRVFETSNGSEVARADAESGVLSPSGRMLATVRPGNVEVWDIGSRVEPLAENPAAIHTAEYRNALRGETFGPGLNDVIHPCGAYSCDGNYAVLAVEPGKDSATGAMEPTPGPSGSWSNVRFPVAQKNAAPTLHVFTLRDKADRLTLVVSGSAQPGFSATGKLIAAAGGRRLNLWNAATGKESGQFDAAAPIKDVVFSADDGVIAVSSEGHLEILSTALARLSNRRGIQSGGISRDGLRAWAWDGKQIELFEAKSGRSSQRLAAQTEPVFSPDSQLLAARIPGGMGVWKATNASRQTALRTFDQPENWMFSPDSKYLVTAVGPDDSDSAARVWSLATGQETARISNLANLAEAGIYKLFADHDPRMLDLIVGHTYFNSPVPISAFWRTSDLAERACQQLTRNMTADEWRTYVGTQRYVKTCQALIRY
jgi:WD40 repeat protein